MKYPTTICIFRNPSLLMSGLLAASVKWCKLMPVEGFGWTGLFPAAKLRRHGTCV